ncbi:Zn(II)2Cys6 transcription factor [Phanerochaete sordida]|uniref:Zn(II)2Cys6 transcription factor n=1 Tax=Phanerochaete sordida TaxID=48140 RepID=A0A9P3L7B9_9APHY|nr:Zn(II)2Cys6 transcription factor [Phanerochaete sordida]
MHDETSPSSPVNGDRASSSTAPGQRVKHARPLSPGPAAADPHSADAGRPTAPKRARKAINCEPCRSSKLKCDRNRPCSSCVLRGTTASCYQNQDDLGGRDDQQQARIDPAAELTRIRHSLNLLESHIVQHGPRPLQAPPVSASTLPLTRSAPPPTPGSHLVRNGYSKTPPDLDRVDSPDGTKPGNAPGMLGQSDLGGFYAGPTSALSHLLTESRDDERPEGAYGDNLSSSLRAMQESAVPYQSYDEDLISSLPPIHTVDGLIDYYFEYCNWIYRHVNQNAFMRNWTRFKGGGGGNRVVFATVCIVILLAVRYLPNGHALLTSLPAGEELEARYYGVMREALQRHFRDLRRDGLGKGYTLDLIELLLLRSHYLTFAKEDPEETWAVKGEVMNIGTAMGLHKDPGDTRFSREEAERRRWAWWHIILLERWQAFMFGRPISIASNHFNTRLPSYCDPSLDSSGRLYLPNLALFKLAYILSDIMNDAVSFQPVAYASVQENDHRLTDWYDDLPAELNLDDYRVARSLGSPVTSVRRLGVQSVIIRTAYHHIRFTLHRPYANIATSLNIAVSAASQLINLVGQTRPDFLSNSALAVPGHMNWGPFHVFSAAMFFSFQLISHPEQPAANLFRDNIRKAIACLEQCRWMPVADKALTILQALAPLYSDEFASEPPIEQKRKKAQVLNLVKTLAFPYQENPNGRGDSSAGSSPALSMPQQSAAVESPTVPHSFGAQQTTQIPTSSVRWTSPAGASGLQHPSPQGFADPGPLHGAHPSNGVHPHPQQHHHHPPPHPHSQQMSPMSPVGAPYPGVHYNMPPPPVPVAASGIPEQGFFMHPPADEGSMWGASVGFGLGEWAQFLDVMQGPDPRGMRNLLNK